MGASAAPLFLMFLANVFAKLAPAASWVRHISAHHYYGNAVLDGLWIRVVVVLLAVTLVLVATAVIAFNRRDVYA